ncbi:hypothetical protein F3J45_23920 [Pantoea sp. Ap-967]|nr:hypothetical protein [Pantoea sp. Ap-967]
MSGFIKLLRSSPPLVRIQLLSALCVTLVGFIGLNFSQWEEYTPPDASKFIAVEGRVSGQPASWENNRSLAKFSVAYKIDGVRQGKPIYTYWELYRQSGLRINSKVLLTVERVKEGSIVRALATLEGRVLYDDKFSRQVIAWNNESIKRFTVMAGAISAAVAVVTLIIALRHRRTLL